MVQPPFPVDELERRMTSVRRSLAEQRLDALLISVPENIYYLTGLDHWGFFACHLLLVPVADEPVLICRAMERVTVENQVHNSRFVGHADHEDIVDHVLDALAELRLSDARLGLEKHSLFITPRIAEDLQVRAVHANWSDASGLVDRLRLVQSPLEMQYTRSAARAADAGMLAGSEYPGFGPFIRPTTRLGEEHTTWCGDTFSAGDAVFLEIAAAVRKYQAPMGRLVYVGEAPAGAGASAAMAIDGMRAIVDAIVPGALAGDVYAAWQQVARDAGLVDYHRHHCGYLVGIGFPPSWTGGSMVTALAPGSELRLQTGMAFHAHSWFTHTDCVDYFISNTVLLSEDGAEVLSSRTPETLVVR